ncbi:transcription elongation factor A N-terminal and central domain-containing protein 2 [Aplysia californica]|uniref:Transcription elongation factor A N-terminal and central domain-containing protein 2 n=1 Tax=Aplysia californica TaxID=6500 RepID=A0ABM0JQL4_APLCA|nr:transcription elongation factor A N-terminal and central domain-containing protein 2 [Aplysia californica]
MDRFVVRTPREQARGECSVSVKSVGASKQSTIHSLPGVVVIEEIKRMKAKLKLPNQSKPVMLECLKELGKKIPPRHVLVDTKIGHIVNKLKKHPDEDISRQAKRVYIKWRAFFEEHVDKPQIEVKCDKKAENMRLRGKTYLSEALGLEREHELVEAIEREAFFTNKRLISPAYRRSMRNFVFKLRNSEELKTSVLAGDLTVEDFVKQYKKS